MFMKTVETTCSRCERMVTWHDPR